MKRFFKRDYWERKPYHYLPKWAGVAWHDEQRRVAIIAPLGISKLMGGVRWLYHASRGAVPPHERDKLQRALDSYRDLNRGLREKCEDLEEARKVAYRDRDSWETAALAAIDHLRDGHGCEALKITTQEEFARMMKDQVIH